MQTACIGCEASPAIHHGKRPDSLPKRLFRKPFEMLSQLFPTYSKTFIHGYQRFIKIPKAQFVNSKICMETTIIHNFALEIIKNLYN